MGDHLLIESADELARLAPALAGAWVAGVDAEGLPLSWDTLDVRDAVFAGCRLDREAELAVRARGAVVLPAIDVPFLPYRTDLYTGPELVAGYEPGRLDLTLDARIGAQAGADASSLVALARGMHDASIDAALTRFIDDSGSPVVGVMGSHHSLRGAAEYRTVAELGRRLARAGLLVATGGGPGLMEAANLGAWLAPHEDTALDDAIEILARAAGYRDGALAFLERALEVRARWPEGAVNLGVPTWVYVDEPPNQFASHIAKYFQNSIRENGLLAIALAGVIFTPGGSGTAQELFTDAAQNDYTLYDVRSPMVILHPTAWAVPTLVDALRGLAERGGWGSLVQIVETVDDAVAAVAAVAPSDRSAAPIRPLRRR